MQNTPAYANDGSKTKPTAVLLLCEFSRTLLRLKHTSDESRTTLSEERAYQSQPTSPGSPGEAGDRRSARGMHVPSSSGSGEVELDLFAPRAHGGHMGELPSKGRADIFSYRFHGGSFVREEFKMCSTASQQAHKSNAGRRHITFGREDTLGVPPKQNGQF